jgi:hypothetical protein
MEKKLRENARWNVNKTIRCLVRNKIKHRKKYKIGKSYPRVSEISLSCTPPGVRFYISHTAKNRNCAVSLVRNVFRWEAGSSFPPVVCKQGRIQDLELRGAWVGKGPGGRTPPPPPLSSGGLRNYRHLFERQFLTNHTIFIRPKKLYFES